MKKYLLAALAAATLVSPASALELPEGVTCTDIFWETKHRLNPTELSDYQECVLATTKPEETQGQLGDLFWVRIDGEYYSANMRNLIRSFGTVDKAFAAFNRKILLEKARR